jgi:ATP/maltotriose-dependent transcriptional regulator MalT/DNA-binding SARP family transcriptional activator
MVMTMTRRHRSMLIDKIVPVPLAPHVIHRPRIMTYLAEAPRRRVTALSAGAGFGKTTALAMWAQDEHCAWYTASAEDNDPRPLARGLVASLALRAPALLDTVGPALDGAQGPDAGDLEIVEALAPALSAALHAGLQSDVTLVIDDLHEVDVASAGMRLVADLCHMAPRRLHLLLASRSDLPFPVARLRLHGQIQVLSAESLRFDQQETAELLGSVLGPVRRADADSVMALTGGWPAAVRLVAERLACTAEPERLLDELMSRGGAADLVDDLLEAEATGAAPPMLAVLRLGAALISFNAELLACLGMPDPVGLLGSMRRRGIHITPSPRDGWVALAPMSREYTLRRLVSDAEVEQTRLAAAGWHRDRGEVATALRYLCLTTHRGAVAEVVERHGPELLAAGHGGLVAEALARLDPENRGPAIDLVEGEACEVRGEWDRAVDCLSRLVPDQGSVPAAAAWRLGLIHHMRGEPDRAMVLYLRGLDDPAGAAGDRALAAAWGAAAAWLMGDTDACRRLVTDAEALAGAGDDRVRAATHTARALLAALDGDRRGNDMHYVRALECAERAGDLLQVIRIRTNRGSRFLEEGYYAEALSELDTAISLAELAGYATVHALALSNRGDAARRIGRYDDAIRDLNAALAIQQRIGSRMAGYALTILGAVYADQGSTTLARAAYEEAVVLAEPSGDLQGLVPALAGLARVVAPDEPALAVGLLGRAFDTGANLGHTAALLAAGWVALGRGDATAAGEHAALASSVARARRDRAGVAEALEVLGLCAEKEEDRYGRLREAESTWQALGCPLPLARTRLALARLDLARHEPSPRYGSTASGAEDVGARIAEIERTCRDIGARGLAAEAVALRSSTRDSSSGPEVAVRTLGGFHVLRRGVAVAQGAWQSRKARDLLKILVAHRGGPVSRGQLCEYLWPEVDPGRAGNRLSVAISTLRLVLDPVHESAADRYVASGQGAVWLRLDRVDVDVESFLRGAAAALAHGDVEGLAAAEAVYAGEFCAEDRYADWADGLREETRSVFVSVERALAQHHAATAAHDAAVRHVHRLLACEPYDEQAYLLAVRELNAAGRHGDARRMYRSYVERMADLDIEPAAYPDDVRS